MIRKAALRERISKGEWVRRAIHLRLAESARPEDPLARLAALDAPTADIDDMNAEILAGRGR